MGIFILKSCPHLRDDIKENFLIEIYWLRKKAGNDPRVTFLRLKL